MGQTYTDIHRKNTKPIGVGIVDGFNMFQPGRTVIIPKSAG